MVSGLVSAPAGASEEPPLDEANDLVDEAHGSGEPDEPNDDRALGDPSELAAAQDEAESSGERVEVTSARNEWDTVYAEPSGEVTLETSIAAVRTRVGAPDGGWREIDTRLEKTADGVRPVAPALPMSFSGGGDDPLAVVERDGHELALSWPDELPEPIVNGDKATYRDVYPGVDLIVTVDPDGTGFSEVLVVESPAAAAKLPAELSLRTEVSAGVKLAAANGGFAVTDGAGDVVFDAPQPVMWDSSGVATDTAALVGEFGRVGLGSADAPEQLGVAAADAARQRLAQPVEGDRVADVATTVAADGRVGLVPDRAMLADLNTEWPVFIDPSTSGSRHTWTMIQSGAPNSTAGYKFSGTEGMGHCDVQVVSACNVDNTKRLVWEFGGTSNNSVTRIHGADVSSATFRAYGAHSYSCANKTVRAYRVNNITSSSTWNNKAGWGSSRQVAYRTVSHKPACNDDRWIEFDVTEAAQHVADTSNTSVRIGLRAKYENSMQDGWKRYRYDAKLSITYNHKPDKPTNRKMRSPNKGCATSIGSRHWIADNTPKLRADFYDDDNQNLKAHFDWDRYDGSGWDEVGDGHTSYGSQGTKTWQTPELSDGRYRWRARGRDSSSYGPLTGYCYFEVDTTAPGQPTLSVSDPYELDTWVDASGRPQVTVTVDADGDSSANKFRYGIGTSTPNSSWKSLSGGDGSFTFTPEFGVTTISARLRDKAGNWGSTRTAKIKVMSPEVQHAWVMNDGTAGSTADLVSEAPDRTGLDLEFGSGVSWTSGDRSDAGDGSWDKALHFDGTGQGAMTPASAVDASESFTIAARVKLDELDPGAASFYAVNVDGPDYPVLKFGYHPTLENWKVFTHSTGVSGGQYESLDTELGPIDEVGTGGSLSPDGEPDWQHLALVYDASTSTLGFYVDGQLAGSKDHEFDWASDGSLRIGRGQNAGGTNGGASGTVDDVVSLDAALGAEQIRRLMGANTEDEVSRQHADDGPAGEEMDPESVSGVPATPLEDVLGPYTPDVSPRWGDDPVWPDAGSATVTVPDTGSVQAGDLPVWIGPADGASGQAAAQAGLGVLGGPTVVVDDFDGSELDSNVWSVVDPLGDGSFTVSGGRLRIGVPAGVEHEPWDADVPRVMHALPDEDVTVEAVFDALPSEPYQVSGLVFEQDPGNLASFDVYHDGGELRLYASVTTDGDDTTLLDTAIGTPVSGSIVLRATRRGDLWIFEFSLDDGATWSVAAAFNHELTLSQVGPYAGNAEDADSPAYTASVDEITIAHGEFGGSAGDVTVTDEFTGASLDAGVWSTVDPLADGSFAVTNDQLQIGVPAGVEHWAWDAADVPRAVHTVPDGDITVEASFESLPTQWYQGSGLLFEQDSDNFVAFEVYYDGDELEVYATTTVDGDTVSGSDVDVPAVAAVDLRATRRGDLWIFEFSLDDGATWLVADAFYHELTLARAGPFAGNGEDEDSPAHTTVVDDISYSYQQEGTEVTVELFDRASSEPLSGDVAVALSAEDSGGGGQIQSLSSGGGELVDVTVDYAGIEKAAGGDFGSRLVAKLVDTACVDAGGDYCVVDTLPTVNDPETGQLTATVPVAATGGGGGVQTMSTGGGEGTTMVLSTADEGPNGDWSATPLSPSGEWSHGGSSGGFSWSYPLATPSVPGELGPNLAFGYSSQSVDGRTSSTNNQPSWIGEGFALDPGFVERRYIGCSEDMDGGASNTVKTGDLCWKTDNAVLSLGGTNTELVEDDATGEWRPKNDDGSRVEHLTGAPNGDNNGEHWRVTTTDGTQYYFGIDERYGGDTSSTDSVLTVPVAGNHSGEPCHGTDFDDSFCDQAWRWMLDYVVDTDGNTMTYNYARETNRYGQNLNSDSVDYDRAGYLTSIEYGEREGSEHTSDASARVLFDVAERCDGTACAPEDLTEDTADDWPDVPFDRICESTSSCKDQVSPTFFTTKRLARVETQVYTGGSYETVGEWELEHSFPDPGDGNAAALWLDSIQHTGHGGDDPITLPEVEFEWIQLPNRVDGIDSAPPMNRMRIRAIHSETGGVTSVDYADPECSIGNVPATEYGNTMRCYPVYWKFEGSGDPELHWFHKHVVESIEEADRTGDGVPVEYYYSYDGDPGWTFNDDEFIKEEHRTWSQFRGFSRVTTRVGNPSIEQLRTESLYLQGMHGDADGQGGTRSVSVTDSFGDSETDHEQFAGMLREQRTFDGDDVVSSTVNDPWRSGPTADDGDTEARIVKVDATRQHTALEGGGWRTTEVEYEFDEYGRVVEANDHGDTSTASDDLCTTTDYLTNTSAWILDTVRRSETVSVECGTSPSRPDDVVSDERYSYDGQAYGAEPTKGHVTRTQVLDDWVGGPVYVATGEAEYDLHGRVTSASDALDRETTTEYTPATGGPVTQVATTNPAGHVSTSVLDPLLGVPTRETDPNGRHTDATYDALGRLTAVWFTDRDEVSESPSAEYDYQVGQDDPVAVATRSLLPDGSYAESVELYDSLLRPLETQAPAAGEAGGRIVSLTEYDTRGLAMVVKGPFFTTGNPDTSLVEPDGSVEREVLSTFDGAGRVILERLMVHNSEHSRRITEYGGDRVHVTPPDGGTATTTISDARANVAEVRHYHGLTPDGAYDTMSYSYTPAGKLASVTDDAGNTWTYEYDLRGRRVVTDDPDAGVSETVYDDASQVISTTDARGETLEYSHDVLGRRTETRDGNGTLLSQWVYDTVEKGLLTASTSFVAGEVYTTSVDGYDEAYRPIGSTVTIPSVEGALAGAYTTHNAWNPDGSLDKVSHEGHAGLPPEVLDYEYDAAGYPEWMHGARTYVADASYSPYGEVEQYALGANYRRGIWQTFDYDEGTRRMASMSLDREAEDPSDVDLAYTYDAAGNPVKIADTGAQAGLGDVQCFTYDHHRRLIDAWSQNDTQCAADATSATIGGPAPYGHTYSYDDAGNRVSLVDHVTDVTTSYDYPAAGEAGPHTLSGLSTSDEVTVDYTYDDAGNTLTVDSSVTGDDQVYDWNPQGRMDTAATETGTSEFLYDADGNRLIRRASDATTLYLHGDEITLDHSTGEVAGQRYYTFAGQTLAIRDSGSEELNTLAADLWGTPTVTIDNYTSTITTRRFDPFGGSRDSQPVTSWPGDRGWHTGTHDDATGLIHMGARQYQPSIGRFLSVDPLMDPFDPDQIHGYAYANNNPLTYSDPSGLLFCMGCVNPALLPSGDTGGGQNKSTGQQLNDQSSSGNMDSDYGSGSGDRDKPVAPDVVGNCSAAEVYRGDCSPSESMGLPAVGDCDHETFVAGDCSDEESQNSLRRCQQYPAFCNIAPPEVWVLCGTFGAQLYGAGSLGVCGMFDSEGLAAIGIDSRMGVGPSQSIDFTISASKVDGPPPTGVTSEAFVYGTVTAGELGVVGVDVTHEYWGSRTTTTSLVAGAGLEFSAPIPGVAGEAGIGGLTWISTRW